MNALLRAEGLTIDFGGIRALHQVRFSVRPASVHALIGPNGAGKSSCFNVISGLYKANDGRVLLGETDITLLPAHDRARLGIGRAFQHVALSPGSTVLDNVLLGRHSLTSGGFLRLPWTSKSERLHATRAAEICDFLGIADVLHRQVNTLSYGVRKRVDIARALAVEPTLLMLDEPAAGMSADETAELGPLITDVRDVLDVAVLLVEHDMGLVMDIADQVTVLDFGRVIADGTPAEVRADDAVVTAYLGAEDSA